MSGYIEDDYIEEDYFEEEIVAITPLPAPPLRGDSPALFIEKADLFLSAFPRLALEIESVATAMNNISTNSVSATSATIADTGSVTLFVEAAKSYLIGQTVRAASALDGTVWMQGDVTAYNYITGELSITMNAKQGSGTLTAWIITMAASAGGGAGGSLSQDFSVKTLRHAISTAVPSGSTIDLTAVTGNFAHVTGNTPISAATMTPGIDVWVVYDSAIQLNYHVSNHQLNSNGANISAALGGMALYTFDGVTVRVLYFSPNGKANAETAPPAGAPVGSALIHFGSTAPANYLICPTTQTNVSRTTYAALFAAIGTTWGAGDSSTTFGLPWFAPGYAPVQAASNVGTATAGQNLAHTHTYSDVDNSGTPDGGTYFTGSIGNQITKTSGSSGGSANLAAGARVLLCVKYQ